VPAARGRLSLTGEDGLLTSMVREVLQAGLDVEMAEYLGYEPYESTGRNSWNSRNGSYPKTVKTDVGTGRIHNWKQILNALTIHYGDRLNATL
jgi:putative transposase